MCKSRQFSLILLCAYAHLHDNALVSVVNDYVFLPFLQLLGFSKRIDSGLVAVGAPNATAGAGTAGNSTAAGSTTAPVPAAAAAVGTSGGAALSREASAQLNLLDTDCDAELSTHSAFYASPRQGKIYSHALEKEGMVADLFGQQSPVSLRERVRLQMLQKGAGLRKKQARMRAVVDQYVRTAILRSLPVVTIFIRTVLFLDAEPLWRQELPSQ